MRTRFIIISLVLGTILLGGIFTFAQDKQKPVPIQPKEFASFKNITSQELASMLKNKDFFFINVHIPYEGEIEKTDAFIPYNEIDRNINKLPQDKNAKIVLYCRSGRMSIEAAQILNRLGYTNIYNLTGGMIDWESKGYLLRRK